MMFFKNYLGMIFFSYLDISAIADLSSKCPTKQFLLPAPPSPIYRSHVPIFLHVSYFFLVENWTFQKI